MLFNWCLCRALRPALTSVVQCFKSSLCCWSVFRNRLVAILATTGNAKWLSNNLVLSSENKWYVILHNNVTIDRLTVTQTPKTCRACYALIYKRIKNCFNLWKVTKSKNRPPPLRPTSSNSVHLLSGAFPFQRSANKDTIKTNWPS